ncbi:hypothetical protein [Paraburkholderia aromaticivorans]|uniref:hypothetical protein n=2 Tax=Burkholderiaceae TaxID=119060 RepID=UPI0038B9B279
MAPTPDAAAGASAPAGRAALLLAGGTDCATAGIGAASAAARTHDAHDASNTPLERNADLNTGREAAASEPSGERNERAEKRGMERSTERISERDKKRDDKNGGNGVKRDAKRGVKRETKREPRRLRDKEIGNVVEGQRNMPEILSPCG